ncbi:MAG: hypothetical protein NVS3B20_17780 [Polyangiales bacterium]
MHSMTMMGFTLVGSLAVFSVGCGGDASALNESASISEEALSGAPCGGNGPHAQRCRGTQVCTPNRSGPGTCSAAHSNNASGSAIDLSATGFSSYVGQLARIVIENRVAGGVILSAKARVGAGGVFSLSLPNALPSGNFGVGIFVFIDRDENGKCDENIDLAWSAIVPNDFSRTVVPYKFDASTATKAQCSAIPR